MKNTSIETIALRSLIYNEDYMRKVLPFLRPAYFTVESDKLLFKIVRDYVDKFNARPSKEALQIDLHNVDGIAQETFEETVELIEECESGKNTENKIDFSKENVYQANEIDPLQLDSTCLNKFEIYRSILLKFLIGT